MAITVDTLTSILRRSATQVDSFAAELNELDGKLGDGDLGATLQKCATYILAALDQPAAGIDGVFKACAMACARASGSSFGTLLGVAFVASAKFTAGQASIEAAQMPSLLKAVLDALIARGGASPGDKTVLDPLDAVRVAVSGVTDAQAQYAAAKQAVDTTLNAFRPKPNRIGRARMFADRSMGMDDPGMVAFAHLLHAAGGERFATEDTQEEERHGRGA
ncbi:DAK2 domain-containing protein [Caballeronia sp. DA-9]|uniref:DAK2 domain-containing protein n=1 Tax=Caballeronia sp. DA-9 TaxID=3436237 RepID=UPI003F666ED5